MASIKRRHLAELRVRSDDAVKHLVPLKDCENAFEDKDDKRFIPAAVRKKSLGYEKNGV